MLLGSLYKSVAYLGLRIRAPIHFVFLDQPAGKATHSEERLLLLDPSSSGLGRPALVSGLGREGDPHADL